MGGTTKGATSEEVAPAAEPAPVVEREVDRVAMVSLRADGSPDQSPGFVALESDDGK